MKKFLLLTAIVLPATLWAQQNETKEPVEAERIIITKKGTDTDKLSIEIDGDNITVNGKPIKENQEGDVTVRHLKIKDLNNLNFSPEANFDNDGVGFDRVFRMPQAPNKAMLGVVTKKDEKGAKIVTVNKETAAEKAGLQEGDIITQVNTENIEAPDELSEALKDKKPGDKVTIAYLRDGKKQTATAELTKWSAPDVWNLGAPIAELRSYFENPKNLRIPRNFEFRANPNFSISGPKLGITIQDVETGSGVKVIELEKGSDADKAGLKEGDIIKEANGNTIKGTDDLLAEKRKIDAGGTLKLKVDRNGKSHDINVIFSKKIKTAEL